MTVPVRDLAFKEVPVCSVFGMLPG